MKSGIKSKLVAAMLGTALAVFLVPAVAFAETVDLETPVVTESSDDLALPTDDQNLQDTNNDDSMTTNDNAPAEAGEEEAGASQDDVPLTAQEDGVDSGFDEEHEMSWQIIDNGDGTHHLSIGCTGNGRMPNYSDTTPAPWSSYASTVTSLSFSSVPNVGAYAFKNFTALTGVDLNASSIGDYAFYGCSNLEFLRLATWGFSGPNEIGASAFENCGVTQILIPETVWTIGARAFYGCPFDYQNGVIIGVDQTLLEMLGSQAFGSSINFTLRYAGSVTRWQTIANRNNPNYANSSNVHCKYAITFDANEGTLAGSNTITTSIYGSLPHFPENDPTRAGFAFDGWHTDQYSDSLIDLVNTPFNSDSTVYAHWIPLFTISFDLNDGSSTYYDSLYTDKDGYLTSFPSVNPTRSQHWFRYWSLDVYGLNKVEPKDRQFDRDTVLYAYWEPYKIYTITLDANGGQLADNVSTVVTNEYGELTELPAAPTNGSQSFAGWYDAPVDGMQISEGHLFNCDSQIYAHWSSTPVYTIVFKLDEDGSATYTSLMTNGLGQLLSLPERPTRAGYDFVGWFTVGGDEVKENDIAFSDDADVFAHWTLKPSFTITFYRNDGNPDYIGEVLTNNFGTIQSVPSSPTREGFFFLGWFTAAEGGEKIEIDKTVFTTNSNAYAHWEEPEYFEVIYVILDGANSTWDPEKSDNLEIRCEGELKDFDHIKVDGVMVDSQHYDLREGSTIVSLKPAYLATLDEGDHDLTFVYKNGGQGSTSFKIPVRPAVFEPGNDEPGNNGNGNNGDDNNYVDDEPIFIPGEPTIVQVADVNDDEAVSFTDNPKTGDNSNALALLIMLIAAFSFGGLRIAQRNRA